MQAHEARAIADNALPNTDRVKVLREVALRNIQETAASGRYCLTHPFATREAWGQPNPSGSEEDKDFVLRELQELGYEIQRHDGDPTDPREPTFWIEVSWGSARE